MRVRRAAFTPGGGSRAALRADAALARQHARGRIAAEALQQEEAAAAAAVGRR